MWELAPSFMNCWRWEVYFFVSLLPCWKMKRVIRTIFECAQRTKWNNIYVLALCKCELLFPGVLFIFIHEKNMSFLLIIFIDCILHLFLPSLWFWPFFCSCLSGPCWGALSSFSNCDSVSPPQIFCFTVLWQGAPDHLITFVDFLLLCQIVLLGDL